MMARTRETALDLSVSAPVVGEQELIAELRAGSVEAFNYLITLYHQPVYGFACRLLGDPADAADAVQEIFLKIFRAAAHFEGKSSLKTWIYRIAVHEASNHRRWWRRHKKCETSLEAPDVNGITLAEHLADEQPSPLQQALRSETCECVTRALSHVAEPFRTVLVLREMEGFSYDEIAEILQVRIGTVKSRLMRGREMLRVLLVNEGATAWGAPAASEVK